jgi:hypothetical protein
LFVAWPGTPPGYFFRGVERDEIAKAHVVVRPTNPTLKEHRAKTVCDLAVEPPQHVPLNPDREPTSAPPRHAGPARVARRLDTGSIEPRGPPSSRLPA